MNTQDIIALFEKSVIPNYTRIPCAITRGEGSWVWDAEGKKYLDLFPGWGVSGLGHCHPHVVEAIQKQAATLLHVPNNFYIEEQGRLAEIMNRASGMDARLFFCNSGAEAAEGAIKLARLHTGEKRTKVITAEASFHGRTFAAISATGQPAYREGFGPTVPGFQHVPYNDIEAMRAAVDDETCAIMVEPVQGEGGVYPASREYLQGLRQLCDQKGLVLIFDEVQTSPGRLGTLFGYQHFGVEPDIMTTAKALAGGVPMGAIMVKPELASSLRPGTHASTFGGSPIASAAAIAVFEAIEAEGLLENVLTMSQYIQERLQALQDQNLGIQEIRVCGLMIGIELSMPGGGLVRRCMEEGLLLNCTHGTVLRMLPAYTIQQEEVDQGLAILSDCLRAAPTE
ncbi:MAG: acetylornithine/succinylornithine family transaminase [Planctomycetota bacterium]|jgi:predicted acetylornithine/succinylornithine family transaminase